MEQSPEDREEFLLEAAAEWSAAGEHGHALTLYERLERNATAAAEWFTADITRSALVRR
ncbi:hypothetical protein [Streptomyces sp. BPTC-684]|uniref:hypothetical protein n=1 Tax=Streptomyces sp. BPTC-684 TaxID=3043734 RepID=UPI0024B0CCF4|nr:hypothetical protein [Streptomyces sp. BPTC-684]WHM39407.1 hypothetical protein QIY60_22685 [Streptomyces sp. BPTC-684]